MALWASGAAAADASSWLSSYEAHAGCPTEGHFREQVERRLAGAPEALGRVRVSVRISRESSGVTGSSGQGGFRAAFRVVDLEQRSAARELADPSCSALVRALGLLVALSADAAPPARPPVVEAQAGLLDAAEAQAPAGEPSDSRLRGSAGAALRVGAVISAAARSALAPEVALGVGLGVALDWAGEGAWAPRLELSLSRFESPEVVLPGEAAIRFEALLVSASACPARLLGAANWSLRPCVDLEGGQLTGHGSGRVVVGAEPRRAPWFAAGLSLRAQVVPFGGPLQLGGALGASSPLSRHEFFFAPDIQGFAVPPVGWNTAASLAWSF